MWKRAYFYQVAVKGYVYMAKKSRLSGAMRKETLVQPVY